MASSSLYNKWRPRTFAEPNDHPLVGQDHVTRTLRNAVARNQIAHAYLFCGPRGTGKTSAARLLARAVNCKRGLRGEPCNECANCQALLSGRQLDLLIEIDGASNRGVDDVRALRERLMQRPGGADLTGRFKVYIIDEVHMLTTEAFNALLKSLEEPPPHVIFVLATTDPQKVPATVASRCQRFDFRPIPLETLATHLANVAREERVRIEPAALELIARTAAGGARDAVSLLDQALAFAGVDGQVDPAEGREVTAEQVQAMLGLTSFDAVCRLVDTIAGKDLPAGLRLVQEVVAGGADLRQFTRQLLEFLRAMLLVSSDAGGLLHLAEETQEAVRLRARRFTLGQLVRLIKLFSAAEQGLKSPSAQPQLPLELAVVEASLEPAPPRSAEAGGRPTLGAEPARPETPGERPVARSAEHHAEPVARPAPLPIPAPVEAANADGPPLDDAPPYGAPPTPESPRRPAVMEAPAATADAGWGASSAPEVPASAEVVWPKSEPPAGETRVATPVLQDAAEPLAEAQPAAPRRAEPPRENGAAVPGSVTVEQVAQRWPAILEQVRHVSRPVEALLKDAQPADVEDGSVIVLEFRHAFHCSKVKEGPNQIAVARAISRALGQPCKVRCVVAEGAETRPERSRATNGEDDPVVVKALRIWRGRLLTPDELAAVEALPAVSNGAPPDAAGLESVG